MSTKETIKKEIERQKSIEGEKCQDVFLLELLEITKSQNQWNLLVDVKFHKYGTMSYESHRFYYPSEFTLKLRDKFKEL